MVFNGMHLALLLFFFVGVLMAGTALTSGFFLAPKAEGKNRGIPYECGMPPIGPARVRFQVTYAIYALIFLAFEVDVLYLFPVALHYREALTTLCNSGELNR